MMVVRPRNGLPIDSNVFRPKIIGLPIVVATKWRISRGKRHGNLFWLPITRFLLIATISEIVAEGLLFNGIFG